jgi:CheY-like chemotaxis protein
MNLKSSTAENEYRLNQIFELSPSFMCVLSGPDFVFEQANPEYYKLIGDRDLIGKTLHEVLPEAAAQGFLKMLQEVRRTGKAFIGREQPWPSPVVTPAATALPLAGKTILVVDDALDNQTILRIFITKGGGTVEIAKNGQEALDKMTEKNFNLVTFPNR